ncbi:MAG TPA: hypothetical protein VEL75_23150 [Candidatus Methylomirabilis sp.]|nr:hypothetical protein [Candidatus Methylomirabilis sp.]
MLEFSLFDRRGYPTLSVREGYREWLPSYETTVEDEMDLALLAGLRSIPGRASDGRPTLDAGRAGRARGCGRVGSSGSMGSI